MLFHMGQGVTWKVVQSLERTREAYRLWDVSKNILKIVQKPDFYGSKLIEYLLEYIWKQPELRRGYDL